MFFFFNDTATTEIYTLSLHDALPIWSVTGDARNGQGIWPARPRGVAPVPERGWQRSALDRVAAVDGNGGDRKSTRLNSSHLVISYAVFCLKKKKNKTCRLKTYKHKYE